MKKVLFLLYFIPFFLPAQTLDFRIGGGLSSHYGKAECVGSYKIGVGYEWEFSQKITVQPALEFQGKGWKNPNEVVAVFDENGNPVIDEETQEPVTGIMSRSATALYLCLPVMFNYYHRMGPSRYVVVGAGPYVACGIGGKQKTKGDTSQEGGRRYFYEDKTFDEPGANRFDAGMQAFIGYQMPSRITVGLEGQFGLARFNDTGSKNLVGLLSLRYAF